MGEDALLLDIPLATTSLSCKAHATLLEVPRPFFKEALRLLAQDHSRPEITGWLRSRHEVGPAAIAGSSCRSNLPPCICATSPLLLPRWRCASTSFRSCCRARRRWRVSARCADPPRPYISPYTPPYISPYIFPYISHYTPPYISPYISPHISPRSPPTSPQVRRSASTLGALSVAGKQRASRRGAAKRAEREAMLAAVTNTTRTAAET